MPFTRRDFKVTTLFNSLVKGAKFSNNGAGSIAPNETGGLVIGGVAIQTASCFQLPHARGCPLPPWNLPFI